MDNNIFDSDTIINNGIPYDDITWQDTNGNPFGRAGNFNAIIFGDANNIVDVSGAVAVGGSFYSPRGLSLSFGNNVASPEYTPELVGFLVGENVAMKGSLVVVGHVVVGGGFNAARGSTFLIGKDGMPDQIDELNFLYQAKGQSPYWSPSDRGSHYIISSYDVPHFIPASRIDTNVSRFFQDAKRSITNYKECIEELPVNGSVEENFHEWVLMGNDPELNVFLLDRRPNGLINKGIRAEVPEGSTTILRLRTGANAHLQYGLIGDKDQASHTLYLFEDATNIHMEVPAAIWGSFLAPQAMLHGHRTGGHISGNLALNSFAVNANSGFEFHFIPFTGSVYCEGLSDISPIAPTPEAPTLPVPEPLPQVPETPMPEPVVPIPVPEPEFPVPEFEPEPVLPIPEEPELEFVIPIPEVPEPLPIAPIPETPPPLQQPPLQPPITTPTRPPSPARPPSQVRPPSPVRPPTPPVAPSPIRPPRPEPRPVLPAPEIPQPIERDWPRPRPCPKLAPCPEPAPCPTPKECPECLIKEGFISGCIWGCHCCNPHGWIVNLYQICEKEKVLVDCVEIGYYGSFEFEVAYNGCYILSVYPTSYRRNQNCFYRPRNNCKPMLSLKNIGVANFSME